MNYENLGKIVDPNRWKVTPELRRVIERINGLNLLNKKLHQTTGFYPIHTCVPDTLQVMFGGVSEEDRMKIEKKGGAEFEEVTKLIKKCGLDTPFGVFLCAASYKNESGDYMLGEISQQSRQAFVDSAKETESLIKNNPGKYGMLVGTKDLVGKGYDTDELGHMIGVFSVKQGQLLLVDTPPTGIEIREISGEEYRRLITNKWLRSDITWVEKN